MQFFFIRIGALAEIRIASALLPLRRGQRVVVRTQRGIEIGHVSASCPAETQRRMGPVVCRVVRPTTESDEMLVRRLEKYRSKAVEACRKRLSESGSHCTLLDVDQLFDGGTIVMQFLGDVDDVADSIAQEVTEEYESVVKTKHLAELLSEGCGPGCGTEGGGGCGTQGGCGTACSSCHHGG
ncbi:PSP1 domain-containing protein [Roseiconus lacunae]|uniref:PSP1 domain-containing protein n=1 Tax=Roseiconus lacunae TaxID=2605694 RepID=UPI001E4DE732|nr:PSP1 domain-containing protein [Roseiconus lacunae]MCD0463499.1 PSP1 domain-containing protein [Roseiconus lacunae]